MRCVGEQLIHGIAATHQQPVSKDSFMKPDSSARVRLVLLLLPILVLAPLVAFAEDAPPSSKSIAAALQPFVDKESLAGAVTLGAARAKIPTPAPAASPHATAPN